MERNLSTTTARITNKLTCIIVDCTHEVLEIVLINVYLYINKVFGI